MATLWTTTLWTTLKALLNELLAEEEHSRAKILLELTRKLQSQMFYNDGRTRLFNVNTVDTYINYLFQAGYLYKVRRGVYGLAEMIPDINLADVKLIAYGEEPIGIQRPARRGVNLEYIYGNSEDRSNKLLHKKPDFFKEEEFVI